MLLQSRPQQSGVTVTGGGLCWGYFSVGFVLVGVWVCAQWGSVWWEVCGSQAWSGWVSVCVLGVWVLAVVTRFPGSMVVVLSPCMLGFRVWGCGVGLLLWVLGEGWEVGDEDGGMCLELPWGEVFVNSVVSC